MSDFSHAVFEAAEGRICLRAYARQMGQDILVVLEGGDSHIGATALACPREDAQVAERPGHREGELAGQLASELALALDKAVAVVCGIHYDGITGREIDCARKLSFKLGEALAASLKTGGFE